MNPVTWSGQKFLGTPGGRLSFQRLLPASNQTTTWSSFTVMAFSMVLHDQFSADLPQEKLVKPSQRALSARPAYRTSLKLKKAMELAGMIPMQPAKIDQTTPQIAPQPLPPQEPQPIIPQPVIQQLNGKLPNQEPEINQETILFLLESGYAKQLRESILDAKLLKSKEKMLKQCLFSKYGFAQPTKRRRKTFEVSKKTKRIQKRTVNIVVKPLNQQKSCLQKVCVRRIYQILKQQEMEAQQARCMTLQIFSRLSNGGTGQRLQRNLVSLIRWLQERPVGKENSQRTNLLSYFEGFLQELTRQDLFREVTPHSNLSSESTGSAYL